jgi:tryptophanyl-tRNA synthetase
MVTDPQRARRHDPGDPEVCVLFPFHKIYSPPETIAEINRECRKAGIGCVDCKKRLIEKVIEALEPVRAKREYLSRNTDEVRQILEAGNRKSRAFAERTLAGVRELIGF